MAQRPGFIMPHDVYMEESDKLSMEEKAQLFDAVNQYSIGGVLPAFQDRYLMAVFNRYRACIDANAGKYNAKCAQLEEARQRKKDKALSQTGTDLSQDGTGINKIKQNQTKPSQPAAPDEMRWYDGE